MDGPDPTLVKRLVAVVGKVDRRLVHVPYPSFIVMGAAKRWVTPGHERGCLFVHPRWGPRCLVCLRAVHKVVLGEKTGHDPQAGLETLVLEGGLLLVPEDGGCLVYEVGHRHGNPLLATNKDPLKKLLPDAV